MLKHGERRGRLVSKTVQVDGEKIRRLRELRSYERKELAELVGLTATSLYRIETGRQQTTRPTLRRLALALGSRPDDLRAPEVVAS